MLLSRDAIVSAVEVQLDADDFYKPAHGHIYDAITSLYAQGEPADPVTVADELARADLLEAVGGPAVLISLQAGTPAIGNAGRYARIVEEHALLRRLIAVAGDIAEIGYSLPDDIAGAVDQAEALVFDVAERRVTDSISPLRDLLGPHLDHLEALFEHDEAVTGVPTGFIDLDQQLAGLQPSNLIIVGGRPGTGKTCLALGMAAHAAMAAHVPVLVFSPGDEPPGAHPAAAVSEARVDATRMRNGRLLEADWPKITNAIGRLAEADIYIDDNPRLTVMEIRAKARRLKSRHGLGLIVVDYLQLMSGRSDAENRQVEVSEISRGLKILARELEVPVVALSQLSRNLEIPGRQAPGPGRPPGVGLHAGRHQAHAGRQRRGGLAGRAGPVPGAAPGVVGRRAPAARARPGWSRRSRRASSRCSRCGWRRAAASPPPPTTRSSPIDGWTRLDALRAGVVHRHPPPAPGPAAAQRRLDRRRAGAPRPPAGRRHHGAELQVRHRRPGQQGAGRGPGPPPLRDRDRGRQGRQHLAALVPEPVPAHPRRASPDAELAGAARAVEVEGVDEVLPRVDLRPARRPGGAVPPPPVGHRRLDHHRPQRPWPDRAAPTTPPPAGAWPSTSSASCSASASGPRSAPPRSSGPAVPTTPAASTTATATASASRVPPARPGSCATVGCHGQRGECIPEALAILDGIKENPNVDLVPWPVAAKVKEAARRAGVTQRQIAAGLGEGYCGSYLLGTEQRPRRFSRDRLAAIAGIVGSQELADIASSDVYWDEVVEVTLARRPADVRRHRRGHPQLRRRRRRRP